MSPRDPVLVPVEVAAEDAVPDTGDGDHVELILANGRSLRGRISMSDAQWIRLIRIAEAA